MADGRDHRCLARAHGAHEGLVVEAPEVLHRASAATDDDQVDAGDGVGLLQALDDRARAGVALDTRGDEPGRAAPAAGPEHFDEIVPDRADLGGHERDDLGEFGQRAFELILEQPFGFQLGLQLLEFLEEVAFAGRLDRVDDQRELAGLAVEIRLHLRDDLHAVAEGRLEPARLERVEHAVDLGLAILEREVVVAGRVGLVAGDFPRDFQRPHPVEMALQDIGEVGDGERGRGHVGRFGDSEGKGKRS